MTKYFRREVHSQDEWAECPEEEVLAVLKNWGEGAVVILGFMKASGDLIRDNGLEYIAYDEPAAERREAVRRRTENNRRRKHGRYS